MAKVFLGGTVNNSTWRNEIIPRLEIDYFNPVVEQWNEKAYKQELFERENSDYCLYVITPKLTSFYSVAEVIDDSNKRPEKTIFCFLKEDKDKKFTPFQIKSMTAIGKMVKKNGGKWFEDINEVIDYLNKKNVAQAR